MQRDMDTKKDDVKIKKGFEKTQNERNGQSVNERMGSQGSEYLDDGAPIRSGNAESEGRSTSRWGGSSEVTHSDFNSHQRKSRQDAETSEGDEYLGGERVSSGEPSSRDSGLDRCFEGLHFPVDKKQILEHVRRNHASRELIADIERLKRNSYSTPSDITREISH